MKKNKPTTRAAGRSAASPKATLPIGNLIKMHRKEAKMSLEELSRRTGITVSTLSRLENGKIAATYDRIAEVATGIGIAMPKLFSNAKTFTNGQGRRSVSRAAERTRARTAQYEYEPLCWELKDQGMFPVVVKLLCRDLEHFGPLVRHEGQEFAYVLRGRARIVTEQYEDTLLGPGDVIYYDSTMPNAILNAAEDGGETLILGCTTVPRLER